VTPNINLLTELRLDFDVKTSATHRWTLTLWFALLLLLLVVVTNNAAANPYDIFIIRMQRSRLAMSPTANDATSDRFDLRTMDYCAACFRKLYNACSAFRKNRQDSVTS